MFVSLLLLSLRSLREIAVQLKSAEVLLASYSDTRPSISPQSKQATGVSLERRCDALQRYFEIAPCVNPCELEQHGWFLYPDVSGRLYIQWCGLHTGFFFF